MMGLVSIDFTSYNESIPQALDALGARKIISRQTAILIKPNLVNASPHPVTTPPECCEAIIHYIRSCTDAPVIIGEGCGDSYLETHQVFDRLGYGDLSHRLGVKLVDLNREPLVRLQDKNCRIFKEMYLPEIAFTHFLISVPVLKAHSYSDITGTLKNMMGLAPPEHYSGPSGSWKKALFHNHMHQSIVELNRYRTPDLSIMDATIGLADFHLGGSHCSPPANKILAGFDPRELDREAATMLGYLWRDIPHLL